MDAIFKYFQEYRETWKTELVEQVIDYILLLLYIYILQSRFSFFLLLNTVASVWSDEFKIPLRFARFSADSRVYRPINVTGGIGSAGSLD